MLKNLHLNLLNDDNNLFTGYTQPLLLYNSDVEILFTACVQLAKLIIFCRISSILLLKTLQKSSRKKNNNFFGVSVGFFI